MPAHRFAYRGTRLLFATLLASLLILSCATAQADDHGGKVVGGYFEEWSIYFANFNIANLQTNGVADKLTHLNYAFSGVSSTGCFIADPWADYQTPYLPTITGPYTGPLYGNFAALQQLKQLHPNLKVLISLAGAEGFSTAASTAAGRRLSPPPVSTCSSMETLSPESRPPGSSTASTSTGNFPLPPTSRTSHSCFRSSAANSMRSAAQTIASTCSPCLVLPGNRTSPTSTWRR